MHKTLEDSTGVPPVPAPNGHFRFPYFLNTDHHPRYPDFSLLVERLNFV